MQEPNATRGFFHAFNPWSVQVRIVVDELTLGHVFLVTLPFPLSVALHQRAMFIRRSPMQSRGPEHQYTVVSAMAVVMFMGSGNCASSVVCRKANSARLPVAAVTKLFDYQNPSCLHTNVVVPHVSTVVATSARC